MYSSIAMLSTIHSSKICMQWCSPSLFPEKYRMVPKYVMYRVWSKETVDSNISVTVPKLLKSAQTQWFLKSLYWEILVFWCPIICLRCKLFFHFRESLILLIPQYKPSKNHWVFESVREILQSTVFLQDMYMYTVPASKIFIQCATPRYVGWRR